MSFAAVEQIARAVLYEGYLLYPYRPTALKNRQRWMFGRLLPRDFCARHDGGESWSMQTECLVVGDEETSLEVRVRFLQLAATRDENAESPASDTVEREVTVAVQFGQIVNDPRRVAFSFCNADVRVALLEGMVVVSAVEVSEHSNHAAERLTLTRRASEARLTPASLARRGGGTASPDVSLLADRGIFKLTVVIENLTRCSEYVEANQPQGASPGSDTQPGLAPCGSWDGDLDQALLRSLLSAHTILGVQQGEFLSLLDPPAAYADLASICRNVGTWPVLVGPEKGQVMLSSPIILSDDPQIAPESPGDLFDGTEIDELLTLRIQTLTDDEKAQMKAGSEQVRRMLERTESLTEDQLAQMHGRFTTAKTKPLTLDFQPGDHVRLQPRGRADAFDLLLKGQLATIISIEHDFEDRVHLCVVIDDDPGKDFGEQGLPAHRFFFNPDEVERLESQP